MDMNEPRTPVSYLMRDNVAIPLPRTEETDMFNSWIKENGIKEPFHKDKHYDFVSAFRKGFIKDNLPTMFNLPMHPSFSPDSIYYKKNMPAGLPGNRRYTPVFSNTDTDDRRNIFQ